MKRIGRYIFNGLTALSLLLCVATVVLWVRSYQNEDTVVQISNSDEITDKCLFSSEGRLTYLAMTFFQGVQETPGFRWNTKKHAPGLLNRTTIHSVRDFGFQPRYVWRNFEYTNAPPFQTLVTVPHWALVTMLALAPSWDVARRLRRRRRRGGCCPKCGYDLRATPGRCPECGTIPAVKA